MNIIEEAYKIIIKNMKHWIEIIDYTYYWIYTFIYDKEHILIWILDNWQCISNQTEESVLDWIDMEILYQESKKGDSDIIDNILAEYGEFYRF